MKVIETSSSHPLRLMFAENADAVIQRNQPISTLIIKLGDFTSMNFDIIFNIKYTDGIYKDVNVKLPDEEIDEYSDIQSADVLFLDTYLKLKMVRVDSGNIQRMDEIGLMEYLDKLYHGNKEYNHSHQPIR